MTQPWRRSRILPPHSLYVREGRVAQDVHREAVVALMLFQEAARQEQLTVRSVRSYTKYLQEARTAPSFRFGQAQTR